MLCDYSHNIRVSSADQNEDRQLAVMRDLKIPTENIFVDKQSGKDFDRQNYQLAADLAVAPQGAYGLAEPGFVTEQLLS